MKKNYRYEGERDGKKRQNIQEAVEFILDASFGTTIKDTDLAKILKYNIYQDEEYHQYKSTMRRIRNFLLQYGYVLKSVSGIGYYILKPAQISSHCYKTYVKRASRLYDKSLYILGRVDQKELNEERKEELESMMKLNRELIDNVLSTITQSKYYSRKDYYNSLKD